ncbi:50S ribosomal protein L33 [Thioalkalivibrio nitratireducens DSM 14787]|uniref:50S ribosomal protein L33 n=1 Tax=Thioalkalivibrio nitratireducens (strain DSM 14787 / UNIQEM 213 / ALEN2) TaxID=1255043 RepID=L0E1D9_THIND|nr:DsrE family protein [Thioalkalivibrio nitratireducens]AGA35020.1 50S ribosomal protein L33 [Thioalkalivibrio nitratireducens DSM 14787]
MADKIVIMLLNLNLERPTTLGAPFFQATVAAVMDLEVEMYFAGDSAKLLIRGVAETIHPGTAHEKSVYSFMQDAHEAGCRFFACAGAMEEHGLTLDNAIPQLDGVHGGGTFIGEVIEDHVVTLTY